MPHMSYNVNDTPVVVQRGGPAIRALENHAPDPYAELGKGRYAITIFLQNVQHPVKTAGHKKMGWAR